MATNVLGPPSGSANDLHVLRTIRRYPRLSILAGVTLLGAAGVILVIAGLLTHRIGAKSDAWRSPSLPAARAGSGQPILQLESHTCGLLSLSAAYALYGLAPDDKNLRFRLGVDVPANPIDSTSTGTLHPDLLRVLVQDGFAYEMPDPLVDGDTRLVAHLQTGDIALILICRRETGGLHWVLCDGIDDDQLRIVDSLSERPRGESITAYMSECVLSVILIEPTSAGSNSPDLGRAHREGAAELVRVGQRLDRLKRPGR